LGWQNNVRWLACFTLCGCGGSAKVAPAPPPVAARLSCPVPTFVQLEVEASDRVNLDEAGRPLPTRLRLYQLSDASRLQNATFEDMWARSQATLADTMASGNELIVYPGQVTVHRFKRVPTADYVVGVAIFREPEGDGWRTIQEWPTAGDPCELTGQPYAVPEKLRLRMFLEDSRIDSVTNYAALPKGRCPPGAACANPEQTPQLRRNHYLRTFEEDPREPEQLEPR
jgi:type VI secretion system VasD/TssJ family lipoprotein